MYEEKMKKGAIVDLCSLATLQSKCTACTDDTCLVGLVGIFDQLATSWSNTDHLAGSRNEKDHKCELCEKFGLVALLHDSRKDWSKFRENIRHVEINHFGQQIYQFHDDNDIKVAFMKIPW